jgi:hypothetical protein
MPGNNEDREGFASMGVSGSTRVKTYPLSEEES